MAVRLRDQAAGRMTGVVLVLIALTLALVAFAGAMLTLGQLLALFGALR